MIKKLNINEPNTEEFYKLYLGLFQDERYKKLSITSKVLYSFLRDRTTLSRANGWADSDGSLFVYFSRENVCDLLNLTDKPVTRAFKELQDAELIDEVRQGLGKPNKIYVGAMTGKCPRRRRKRDDSGIIESPIQTRTMYGPDSENLRPIQTEYNQTEYNQTEYSKDLPLTELTYLTVSNLLSPKGEDGSGERKKAKSAEAWDAYAEAYQARYGIEPVRNAKVNKQLCTLVDRLGSEATDVIKHYLKSNEKYYVSKGHSVDPLLSDAEKLRTQWKTKDAKPSKERELEEYFGPSGYATWLAAQSLKKKLFGDHDG